jgi:hypothetical protein
MSAQSIDTASGQPIVPVKTVDQNGNQLSSAAASTDGQSASNVGLTGLSYLFGFNGASWDRMKAYSDNADAVATSNGVLATSARLMGFNGATYDRVRVDGNKYLQVNSNRGDSIATAPTVGQKNVTTTALELYAGASARMASRYAMTVYNESNTTVYWGSSASVTTANGFPLLPGDSVTFTFKIQVATAIYFIGSTTASTRVVELA